MNQIQSEEVRKRRNLVKRAGIVFVLVAVFFAGNISTKYGLVIGNKEEKNILSEARKYRGFDTLFEVRDEIEKRYVGDLDDDKLVTGAIKGMIESIGDPYTVYMTKEEYDKYMESNSGEFMGIGVFVTKSDEGIKVYGLIEDAPAQMAEIGRAHV